MAGDLYSLWELENEYGREQPTTDAPLGLVRVDGNLRGLGWNDAVKNAHLILEAVDPGAEDALRRWAEQGKPVSIGFTGRKLTYSLESVRFGVLSDPDQGPHLFSADADLVCELPFDGGTEWLDARKKRFERTLFAYGVYDD